MSVAQTGSNDEKLCRSKISLDCPFKQLFGGNFPRDKQIFFGLIVAVIRHGRLGSLRDHYWFFVIKMYRQQYKLHVQSERVRGGEREREDER